MKSATGRRHRRTNLQIEKDIFEATRQEIIARGFGSLTLIGIVRRAKINPKNFYKRYKDLHELLHIYVEKSDYWSSSVFDSFDKVDQTHYQSYVKSAFRATIEHMIKDKSMQELILWELSDDNDITRNANRMREERTSHVVDVLDRYFADQGLDIDFRAISSVILCAVYFLVINKCKSTYCGVDFKSKKGQQLLLSTVEQMIDRLLFAPQNPAADLTDVTDLTDLTDVARKMKLKGIEIATICECTGLDSQTVTRL